MTAPAAISDRIGLPTAGGLMLGLLALSLMIGSRWLDPAALWEALWAGPALDQGTDALLVWFGRLPRAVLAMLVGGALAVAGLLMQTLSRNPLATPSILGVGNGANLGLVIALVSIPGASELAIVIASFLGALGSALIIALIGVSTGTRMDGNRLVIGGSILASLLGSILTAIIFFNGMQNVLLSWTLGRLVHVDWVQVAFAAPAIAVGTLVAYVVIHKLEAFRLGGTTARGLGVPVVLVQVLTLGAVVLLAGASVATAGPVAFVGLMVPHLVRRRPGRSPLQRLILVALVGALMAGTADLLARVTSGDRLIPLGIWTMAMGSIFFFSISLHRRADESHPVAGRGLA